MQVAGRQQRHTQIPGSLVQSHDCSFSLRPRMCAVSVLPTIKKPLPIGSGYFKRQSPLPNRAGRTIAHSTVESPPTTWALRGSEIFLPFIARSLTGIPVGVMHYIPPNQHDGNITFAAERRQGTMSRCGVILVPRVFLWMHLQLTASLPFANLLEIDKLRGVLWRSAHL